MMTQSRVDCKEELIKKHGLDGSTSDFIHMWDFHYKHEEGKPFEDELKKKIKETLPEANQKELYDLILTYFEDAKIRRRFFEKTGFEDYGFEVIERDNGRFKLKLRTYDKEKANAYWEALRLDAEATPPDTSEEIPPARALVIKDHHGIFYYKTDTPEMLIEKAVEFIMIQVPHYHKPEEHTVESKLGMTEEEVNAMPEGAAKEAVLDKLKWVKDFIEGNYEHLDAWDALKQIKKLKGNSKFRDITKVLNFYQGDRWEGKWNIVKLG